MIRRFAVPLLLWFTLTGPAAAQELWQAGSARVNITPQQFMWMSGYGGRTTPAEGKLTDLWVKALALEDPAGHQAVLITADLVGIGGESTRRIAAELKSKYGLSRNQFAISTSHTHTGPALSDNLVPLHYLRANEAEQARIVDYTIQMRNKCVEVVGLALKAKQPSHITWGSGQCTVAVNRRNNSEKNVPQLRIEGKLQGPFDHDVPVLVIRDKAQQLKTVVFGYACHATVLPILKWSGDYPGYAQLALEEMHPGINAMFWAGCGADQNPLPRRTVALAQHYGRRLAISVDKVINGTLRPIEGNL
ncbi:MAG: neutral/alkaline non-lysosomal ceramidase N-terminal domain-containing protein, partial [Planctomycetaceae bacterium]